MTIKDFYTTDHDTSAGYGGRIGFRYKTVVRVAIEAKLWNDSKRKKALGTFVVGLSNALYRLNGFSSSYSPMIDTKARAKNGITVVSFEYFHNNDSDAEKMKYTGTFKKLHIKYQGASSQVELDPNRSK
jgi:hypothetical protein